MDFRILSAVYRGRVAEQVQRCRHPAPDQSRSACSDECTAATWISTLERRICRQAARMPGHTWAQGRCEDAHRLGHTARTTCLECGVTPVRRPSCAVF